MDGLAELARLAFGCLTFMGSAACCYELAHMGPGEVEAAKKQQAFFQQHLQELTLFKAKTSAALLQARSPALSI